jgi:hypothetical protein
VTYNRVTKGVGIWNMGGREKLQTANWRDIVRERSVDVSKGNSYPARQSERPKSRFCLARIYIGAGETPERQVRHKRHTWAVGP